MDPVPPALRDRLEVLELPGYTREEKLSISKQFLVPKQLEEHGLSGDKVAFDDSAIAEVIDSYTREAGVRNLEREIANVIRAIAVLVAEGKAQANEKVTVERIGELLGPAKHFSEVAERTAEPGVATGLAWTPVGGDILFIEAGRMPGGSKGLIMTGQLGPVMQESVQAALTWVRGNAAHYGIDPELFKASDIHIHVPAGAIPKDGPSAGVTMAAALVSMLTGRLLRANLAMTGEITLTGQVLPVGGIKEKVLAAKRGGVHEVILPFENEVNVREDLKTEHIADMKIDFVKTAEEAMVLALEPKS